MAYKNIKFKRQPLQEAPRRPSTKRSVVDRYPVLVVWSSEDGSIQAFKSREDLQKAVTKGSVNAEDQLYGGNKIRVDISVLLSSSSIEPSDLIDKVLSQFKNLGEIGDSDLEEPQAYITMIPN